MPITATYSFPEIADARGYFNLRPTASYARIKIAAAYQDFGVQALPPFIFFLGDTVGIADNGEVMGQDYIDPSYFLSGGYVADFYRLF